MDQQAGACIYSKIDRVLANQAWLDVYPNSEAHFLAEDTSDHSPGLVIFYTLQHLGPKPFKYFDMWSTDPIFQEVVTSNWKKRTKGNSMQQIALKLKRLQKPRKLNREKFSEVQVQFATAKENLSNIRLQLQEHPFQENLYEEEKRLVNDYQLWQTRLESFLVQKTKEDWLNLGDTNNKYFFCQDETGLSP